MLVLLVALILVAIVVLTPQREFGPAKVPLVVFVKDRAEDIEGFLRALLVDSQNPLLVIDGGSSDETVSIVERLKSQHPSLHLMSQRDLCFMQQQDEPVLLVVRLDLGHDARAVLRVLQGERLSAEDC